MERVLYSIWKASLLGKNTFSSKVPIHKLCSQRSPFRFGQTCSYKFTRYLHCTQQVWLRTLFSEEEQNKIMRYLNGVDLENKNPLKGKLKPLQKVVECRSINGPLHNINDLLEKCMLSSTSAVSLCYAVLKSNETSEEPKRLKIPQKPSRSRRFNYLQKSINPIVQDPEAITKLVAVTIAEHSIGYTLLESQESNWKSQRVSDWHALDVTGLSGTNIIFKLWKALPAEEFYVLSCVPRRGIGPDQSKNYGAALSVLCAKTNFNEDAAERIFEVHSSTSARHFNFVVGNELVSPQSMVSHKLNGEEISTPDDHVFGRSLSEVTFSVNATVKYNLYKDDMKEPLCQSLLLGKTFVDYLQERIDKGHK